jgi:uncharacterized membrane protein
MYESTAPPRTDSRIAFSTGVALALSCIAVTLVAVRVAHTGSVHFGFLLWNLFLALVPLALSTLAVSLAAHERTVLAIASLTAWLLFYPNAPYMLTDLIHLRARVEMPLLYDAALLATFAACGTLIGAVSLRDAHNIVTRWRGARVGWAFASFAIVSSSFGIYLGRFGRWNSWDIVTQPAHLLTDVLGRVGHPLHHPRTWAVTAFLSLFSGAVYLAFRSLTLRIGPRLIGSTATHR